MTTLRHTAALLALPLLATGCGPEAQVKRQAGSWTQKIEIVKLEGNGATPDTKVQMQKMFDAMSGLSICLTPAAAAKEDLGKNMEQMGSRGQNCTFGKRDVTGATIGFDAVCKQANGGTMKLSASGTNAAECAGRDHEDGGLLADRCCGRRDGNADQRHAHRRL